MIGTQHTATLAPIIRRNGYDYQSGTKLPHSKSCRYFEESFANASTYFVRIMKHQLLIIGLLSLALGTAGGGAANISGTWDCSIDQKDEDGPMRVTFVFKHDGETLTGAYSDAARRNQPITGTVKGDKVAFSYEAKPPAGVKKPGLIVGFTGTIESPTRITGTLPTGSPYCAGGCKWTAIRKK